MSVLQDAKYPTKASKYWQCVREQNVFLENLMSLYLLTLDVMKLN